MSKLLTPMDMALAGLGLWRRQAQSAAIIGMRMSGVASSWAMPPSEALDLLTRTQMDMAASARKMSEALRPTPADEHVSTAKQKRAPPRKPRRRAG